MEVKQLKLLPINKFNAIADIVAAVLTGTALAWMFVDSTAAFYYVFGLVMLVTNIVGLIQQKKKNGKLVGNILGIIAGALHLLTALLCLPAMILYILASVFTFKNKVE